MSQPITNVTYYRVIYGDTDQMGVVYYANYLRWFEQGRSEFLRQMGIPYATIEERGLHFPVVEVACRYFKSARYDELIHIETRLASVTRAALAFSYRILRTAEPALVAEGSTRHACVDSSGRVRRMAPDLRHLLESALAPLEAAPK